MHTPYRDIKHSSQYEPREASDTLLEILNYSTFPEHTLHFVSLSSLPSILLVLNKCTLISTVMMTIIITVVIYSCQTLF